MPQITVRRHLADEARSQSDFVVSAGDAKQIHRHLLQDVLRNAQAERGVGVWSDSDPEVWVGGTFVGRLGRGGDIAQLARQALDELSASVGRRAAE